MSRFVRLHLSFLLCALCIFIFSSEGEAQSGRRVPKRAAPTSTAATPDETKESQPSSTPTDKPAAPRQQLIVGMDDLGRAIDIPRYMSDAVLHGFLERLRDVPSLTVNTDRDMSRKQATDRAKKQTDTFVVLLKVETEYVSSGGSSTTQATPDDLLVSYIIFTPLTAKVKDQGRVYVRSARGILGGRLPSTRSYESQLSEAGRAAASRVISTLHLGIADNRP